MNALKIPIIAIFLTISISSPTFAFNGDWWRSTQCVTPKSALKIRWGANESSGFVKICSKGEKMQVVYGRKILHLEEGTLKEEEWFEVKIKEQGWFIYGWVKTSEVKECERPPDEDYK